MADAATVVKMPRQPLALLTRSRATAAVRALRGGFRRAFDSLRFGAKVVSLRFRLPSG